MYTLPPGSYEAGVSPYPGAKWGTQGKVLFLYIAAPRPRILLRGCLTPGYLCKDLPSLITTVSEGTG